MNKLSINPRFALNIINTPPAPCIVKAIRIIKQTLDHSPCNNYSITLFAGEKDCYPLKEERLMPICFSLINQNVSFLWLSIYNTEDEEKLTEYNNLWCFEKNSDIAFNDQSSDSIYENYEKTGSDNCRFYEYEYYSLEGEIDNKEDELFLAKIVTDYLINIQGIKFEDITSYIALSDIYSEEDSIFEISLKNDLGNDLTLFQIMSMTKAHPKIEMISSNETIVIPDIHGRTFWRDVVKKNPTADIIFLGDYLDPYPNEGITPEDALKNLEEIIAYAKSHKNCQLLLGNHDLHYLYNFGEACRLDYVNFEIISQLLLENIFTQTTENEERSLFKIVDLRKMGDHIVVFSHAPILTDWLFSIKESAEIKSLALTLNSLLGKNEKAIIDYLGQISTYRGGCDRCGSPIWADIREINPFNIIPTVDYSVFGHTQQPTDPVITDRWACLDCRKAFVINSKLEIRPL